jgi:hypothetical protein
MCTSCPSVEEEIKYEYKLKRYISRGKEGVLETNGFEEKVSK